MPVASTEIDPMLEARLAVVARQLRDIELHRTATFVWLGVTAAGALLLAACAWLAFTPMAAIALLGVAILSATFWTWRQSRQPQLDLRAAARVIEAQHPELQLALQTALEQRAEAGQFTFLQRRVITRAVEHANRHRWTLPRGTTSRWKKAHVLAMTAAFCSLVAVGYFHRATLSQPSARRGISRSGLSVTPGNAEVERRSIVVVTARFGDRLPKDVRLIWQTAGDEPRSEPMAKSLADPVFAFSLPPLEKDATYQIEHDGERSETFTLTVFDLPALVRADATLTYPDYTGLARRTVAETRRVSAVEGTQLRYEFTFNKPVRVAALREANTAQTSLTPLNAEKTRFALDLRIDRSHQFTLRLEDDRGRASRAPEEIRIEALPNKRPVVRLTSPTGDPRVSPIEEAHLRGEARDDFGLLDYGVGYALNDQEPEYVSLKNSAPPSVEAKFENAFALESRKVEPGQLLTWFAWADDYGPDGKTRRTTSDLHFSEVRPLDEIFREDESGGSSSSNQNGGGGQEALDLVELQQQISVALWKLIQEPPPVEKRKDNLNTLTESQRAVRQRLEQSLADNPSPERAAKAERAKGYMQRALDRMSETETNGDPASLRAAWSASQGAYQQLLTLLPKETRVTQSNSRSGRSGGQRGNQRQLNELDLKQSENRYETESEAQAMTTPEQREQLQALSKLRELARRQQEVNQRLQELQTALAAARDEAQREEVRRELKRLEEEQRRMLADADDLRQRMDQLPPGSRTQQAREQLERARESMRQSGERLERGEVSPALASGARAAEDLEKLKEDFRRESSSQFSEQLRQARAEARQLAEQQKAAEQKLNQLSRGEGRSLDDSAEREALAKTLEEQRAAREKLLNDLRRVAEDSETSEPGLHRRVYDVVRQHGQSDSGAQLQAGAEMLRHGFVPQAEDAVKGAGRELQQLRNEVERAADSVLGSDTEELRFAQRELDNLSRELQREQRNAAPDSASTPGSSPENIKGQSNSEARLAQDERAGARGANGRKEDSESPSTEQTQDRAANASGQNEGGASGGSSPRSGVSTTNNSGQRGERRGGRQATRSGNRLAGGPGASGAGGGGGLENLLRELSNERNGSGGEWTGPLTGDGFNDWFERLRTVEELTSVPEAQQRLAAAREAAETLRRDFKRHGKEPQWATVDSGIAAPLAQARVLLRQELARRENPEALQPVDRDPVPDKYAESVRQYYEALGR